jgi:hypothetical protein
VAAAGLYDDDDEDDGDSDGDGSIEGADDDDEVDELDDDSGATAQPDGSLTGADTAGDSGTIGSYPASGWLDSDSGSSTANGVTDSGSAAAWPLLSRLRKAVTSPPVDTMLTTDHPSADLSLSLAARAEGSYDDELTVVNSCMGRDGIPAVKLHTPRRQVANTNW